MYQPRVSEKICKDIGEFCINAEGHAIFPVKVKPGAFNSYYLLVEALDFLLMIRQVEHGFNEAGYLKEGTQGFAFILDGESIIYNGQKFRQNEKFATHGTSLNAVLSTNLRMLSCFINIDNLKDYFIPEEIELFHQGIETINAENKRIKCTNEVQNYLLQLVDGFSNETLILETKEDYENVKEQVYQCMFDFATEDVEAISKPIKPNSRTRILNECLSLIHDDDSHQLKVSDLSKHVNTTQRNLQKLFLQHLGVSPKSYLTSHKLNFIHSALMEADPETTNVNEISRKFGINHQGNFAKAYKDFYGEYPHQTLLEKNSVTIFKR